MLPYNDDIMRDVFHLIEESFQWLNEIVNPTFVKRLNILEIMTGVLGDHEESYKPL